jgi:hypothetical protein
LGGALVVGEWIAGFVRILLGMMLFAGLYEYAPPSWSGFEALLALMALSFLVTFFHELAHALAVWWQRGSVLAISVFGLTYLPRQRRLTFEALPRGGDLGGFVRLRPPEGGWTRWQHAIVLAAGPFSDAIVSLLALAASAALSIPASSPEAPLASMLMVVAFISSLGNLLPYRGSDGAGLLALWRGRNRFARTKKPDRK